MAIKHANTATHGSTGTAQHWNAEHIIDSDVDFEQFAAVNLLIDQGTIYPVLPLAGQIFFRTDSLSLNVYDGLVWQDIAYTSDLVFIRKDGTVAFTGDQSLGTHRLKDVQDPTLAQDAATKNYVDTHGGGGGGGSGTTGQIAKWTSPTTLGDATNTDAQVSATVAASHARSHAITGSSDHTSSATSGRMLKADANGLPIDATNTDAAVSAAVGASHTQGTDTTLGSMTAAVNMNTHQINNLAAPSNPNDAARLTDVSGSSGNVPVGTIVAWLRDFLNKENGRTTSTTANKLVDSGATFTTHGVAVSDIVRIGSVEDDTNYESAYGTYHVAKTITVGGKSTLQTNLLWQNDGHVPTCQCYMYYHYSDSTTGSSNTCTSSSATQEKRVYTNPNPTKIINSIDVYVASSIGGYAVDESTDIVVLDVPLLTTVTNVDSQTQLSLAANIATTGMNYEISTATLTPPTGWMECSGQIVTDATSSYYNRMLPDLNAANTFLVGGILTGVNIGNVTTIAAVVDQPQLAYAIAWIIRVV